MMLVKNNQITIIFIIVLSLFLTLLLRGSDVIRGTDTIAYMDLFDGISEYSRLSNQYYMNDYGFSNYSFLISKFTDSSFIYLFITFFISTLILLSSYYIFLKEKQSTFLFISIIFLLFSSSFYFLNHNGIRQGISLSFVMLSYAFYYENKKKTSFIFLLVAFSFHKSAILAFLALIIFLFRSSLISPIYIFYVFMLIGLIIDANLYIQFFEFIELDNVSEKIKNFNRPTKGNTSVTSKILVLFTLVNYFALLRKHTKDKLFSFLTGIYISYAALSMLLITVEALVNRIMLFFGLIEPLIFALSIQCFKHRQKVFPFIIIFGFMYFAYVLQHPSFRSELRLL